MSEDSEPIVKPLTKVNKKGRVGSVKKPRRKSEIDRLCEMLCKDLREKRNLEKTQT